MLITNIEATIKQLQTNLNVVSDQLKNTQREMDELKVREDNVQQENAELRAQQEQLITNINALQEENRRLLQGSLNSSPATSDIAWWPGGTGESMEGDG